MVSGFIATFIAFRRRKNKEKNNIPNFCIFAV
jgi:hypothetical protein